MGRTGPARDGRHRIVGTPRLARPAWIGLHRPLANVRTYRRASMWSVCWSAGLPDGRGWPRTLRADAPSCTSAEGSARWTRKVVSDARRERGSWGRWWPRLCSSPRRGLPHGDPSSARRAPAPRPAGRHPRRRRRALRVSGRPRGGGRTGRAGHAGRRAGHAGDAARVRVRRRRCSPSPFARRFAAGWATTSPRLEEQAGLSPLALHAGTAG